LLFFQESSLEQYKTYFACVENNVVDLLNVAETVRNAAALSAAYFPPCLGSVALLTGTTQTT
jgi:hypothetical protein